MATAIEEDLFEVYYQPLYDLKEKRYRTMEALSRLRHPSLGMISPEVFIGIAEKHGQIAKLGYLQFRKVCKFIKEHPQIMEKIESIKYNLSPLELLKSGYSKGSISVCSPGCKPIRTKSIEPILVRIKRKVGKPIAAVIRRT